MINFILSLSNSLPPNGSVSPHPIFRLSTFLKANCSQEESFLVTILMQTEGESTTWHWREKGTAIQPQETDDPL